MHAETRQTPQPLSGSGLGRHHESTCPAPLTLRQMAYPAGAVGTHECVSNMTGLAVTSILATAVLFTHRKNARMHTTVRAGGKDTAVTAQAASDRMSQGLLDEERLLVERARRNPAAFGDIYVRYHDRIYTYIYSRTHDREIAEDITADTFVLALEGIGKYEWRNVPFGAWLFRIAANQVAGHYRRFRPHLDLNEWMLGDPGPEEEAMRHSDAEDVRTALTWLKTDQRRAMELRYHQGMRAREIAAEMSRTETAVKLLLHRGMLTLRLRMLPLSA